MNGSTVHIELTKEATTQVQELIRGQKPGTAVRLFVQSGGGGGCGDGCGCGAGGGGGPAVALAFDRQRNGDQVIPVNGFSLVVDPMSAEFVDGAKIDFVQSLDSSGFKVTAPKIPETPPPEGGSAGGGCGCGSGGGCC